MAVIIKQILLILALFYKKNAKARVSPLSCGSESNRPESLVDRRMHVGKQLPISLVNFDSSSIIKTHVTTKVY